MTGISLHLVEATAFAVSQFVPPRSTSPGAVSLQFKPTFIRSGLFAIGAVVAPGMGMDVPAHVNALTDLIIGKLIRVHRAVGPGLLESIYRRCVAYELQRAGCVVEEERKLPLIYEELQFDCAYRLDMIVNDEVVVEIKSVQRLEQVHGAQLLTYLRLSNCPVGLLVNFNTAVLKDGLRRFINPRRTAMPARLADDGSGRP